MGGLVLRIPLPSNTLLFAAGIRLFGAALLLGNVVVGVRLLGPPQFGVSIIILAVSQLLALPAIGNERLVVRLAAIDDTRGARAILRSTYRYGALVFMACVITACALAMLRPDMVYSSLAVGLTAGSIITLTVKQGYNRGAGRMLWGQVPNEVVKPAFMLLGFLAVTILEPENSAGAIATVIASALTLCLAVAMPPTTEPLRRLAGSTSTPPERIGSASRWMLLLATSSTAIDRAYPLVLGAFSTTTAVAELNIASRIVQLGGFGLALGAFVFSPQLAQALRPLDGNRESAARLAMRIRLLALATALPVAILCVSHPDAITDAFGAETLDLDSLLLVAAVALLLNSAFGPIQTVALMGGHHQLVAIVVTAAFLLGLAAGSLMLPWSATSALTAQTISLLTWNLVLYLWSRRQYGQFI